MNRARRIPQETEAPLPAGDGALMEPYPHHPQNTGKLEAHVDSVFIAGAELLRTAIDSPFQDALSVLENTEHFGDKLSKSTAMLPYCSNSIKFYSSLGASDPDAFHTMIVNQTHKDLISAFNRFAAEKTIRSGKKWEHYVQKHLTELHDSALFNRKVTAPTPVYKKAVVAAPTARPSLLPPVRPPTTHTKSENPYAGMPELRCHKTDPDSDDDSWEGEGGSYLAENDVPPELGEPIGNHHEHTLVEKLQKAERHHDMDKIRKYRKKLGVGDEFADMPPLKMKDEADEGRIGFFREIYYGEKKRHAQRQGTAKGNADAKKYQAKEDALKKKKNASNEAEAERRQTNREIDKEHEADLEKKYPGVRESKSPVQRQKQAADDKIDPSNPAEKLKSVKWLRECCSAEGARRVTLKAGAKYIFFAPSDDMIDQLLAKFAKTEKQVALSKERVVSAHLAEQDSTTTFKTMAGVHVEKSGTTIVLPTVKHPQILGVAKGRVASVNVKGCTVIVLPHDNLFQVSKK
jgi:hypothetical protein